MSQIPESVTSANVFDPNATSDDALRGLDIESFLDLFIAELQNQDPLNPLDNAQILQQISQIREVGATDKLTDRVDKVTVVNGSPRLHIGSNEIELSNVREILPSDDDEEVIE